MNSPSVLAPHPQANTKMPVWKISPSGGKYFVNSVAVSADGDRVIAGTFFHTYGANESRRGPARRSVSSSENGTFGTYCYDATGRQLWANEFTGWQGVYWVAISADGAKAAAGGLMAESPQAGFVRAFEVNTAGKLLLDYPTQQRVNQVALSEDGEWLVSAAETLVLFHFDPKNGGSYVKSDEFTPVSTSVLSGYANAIVSVGISSDGATIVYADYSGNIGVFANDAGKLSLRKGWKLPASFCHMIQLTPDGRAFAAGGAAGVFYWCDTAQFVADGAPTITYPTGLSEAVYGVAIAEKGDVFAGVVNVGDTGRAYAVTVADFEPQVTDQFSILRNPNSVSLNLAHGLLAVADGHPDGTPGHFYLFSGIVPAGESMVAPILRWIYETGNMSWPVVISTNGKAVVGGSDDTYVYYFTP